MLPKCRFGVSTHPSQLDELPKTSMAMGQMEQKPGVAIRPNAVLWFWSLKTEELAGSTANTHTTTRATNEAETTPDVRNAATRR